MGRTAMAGKTYPQRRPRILILNRRDPSNPRGGGAEVFTREIFGRLARTYDISHFSANFPGSSPKEVVENITYLRKGNEVTTHVHGHLFSRKNSGSYDLIINQFNGIGFFTEKLRHSVLLVHQLYEEFWTARFGLPGHLLKAVERGLLRRHVGRPVITVSESTRQDLLRLGFPEEDIRIVMNGVNCVAYPPKEQFEPTVLFLGRMVRTKRPEHALKAFLHARESLPSLRLYMVGEGEQRAELEGRYKGYGGIHFTGFVPEERKYALLREASVLLVPSIREGWGQVVLQANMAGTPAIGYEVPGIRDSVVQGVNGILIAKQDYAEMGRRIVNLLSDRDLLGRLSSRALLHARGFSWDASAQAMEDALRCLVEKEQMRRRGGGQ